VRRHVAIKKRCRKARCDRKGTTQHMATTQHMGGQTLYDKVWASHVVKTYDDGDALIYIDRHLVQEVSSPQAFAGLITENRTVWRPDAHVAVADHAVPTRFRTNPLPDV
jgi:3-isopropylmalate/(R)-2-methylmalate dehydratase large subunit